MSWWQTALVALGSAGLGGGLTGAASWVVFKRQERAALARDVRVALADYFGALVIAVSEITRAPENPPDVDPVRWLTDSTPAPVRRWFAAQRWVKTEKGMRRIFGSQPYANIERAIIAYAHLQVMPLPAAVEHDLAESLKYVEELSAARTQDVKDRWPAVRDALLATIREHVVDSEGLARALQEPLTPARAVVDS
jgi:hypothetical protein